MTRCDVRKFMSTRAPGAPREAGDIVLAIRSGAITADNIVADLFELARGERSGRPAGDGRSITLFKSVGAALEDLAAAGLAVDQQVARRPAIHAPPPRRPCAQGVPAS